MADISDAKFWVRTILVAALLYWVFGPIAVLIYAGIKLYKCLK